MAITYPADVRHWSLRRTRGNPLEFLEELARVPGDFVPFSLAGKPAFLLKHPDLAEAMLVADPDKFTKSSGLHRAGRLLGEGLLTAEGEQHRHQRRAVQPLFHRQCLEKYAEIMVAEARRVRDSWGDDGTIDAASESASLTLSVVGRTLFGNDLEEFSTDIRDAVRAASESSDPLISLLAPSRRVRHERDRLSSVVDTLIARHRSASEGHSDLIAVLLASHDSDSPLAAGRVRDDALTILLAGHDTIASALVWTWSFLARFPSKQARLEHEVDGVLGGRSATAADLPALVFARNILAESIRLYPPAWVIARSAVADVDLLGNEAPAGAILLVSPYLLHRDPRFFGDPAAFDPDRWLEDRRGRPKMAFIPFGAGPRACIGEGFAWMEGVLLLATFAQRWRFELNAESLNVAPRVQMTLRPPPSVRLTVHERH